LSAINKSSGLSGIIDFLMFTGRVPLYLFSIRKTSRTAAVKKFTPASYRTIFKRRNSFCRTNIFYFSKSGDPTPGFVVLQPFQGGLHTQPAARDGTRKYFLKKPKVSKNEYDIYSITK